ncbi:MRN complex-interacting protein isoform X2 [Dromaius novaehollandiae]|uniref:MRN complex-interacting protein isoform X2 n=1 Tax=Dromaius novaehollandiae TaxID=8790 RepID=UPI0031203977
MAPRFWALRCCSCRLFQVQQAKRSGKWSCAVCGQKQAVQKVYGEGSGLDCRLHVQKLNLLQGEAEEALSWTSRYTEESVDDNKNIAVQREDSLVQQEGKAEVSRWSKYLDQGNETQADEEEESGGTERQQFCSRRKNTVEEQRKHQNSFPYTDVQELSEENGAFQVASQAKKRKQCSVAVPNQGDGEAVCGDSMIPALCESLVSEGNTQTPAASIKPSKWEKFLSCSDSCSENAAKVTLSPQEGSRKVGLHSTTAADIFMASSYSKQAGNFLPPGVGTEFKKSPASTEQLVSELPRTVLPGNCSDDVVFKEPQGHLIRAGRCHVTRTVTPLCPPATTSVISNPGLKPSSISHEHLFCTGDEFDDDL